MRQRVEETAAVIPEPVAKKSRIVSFDSMLAEYADVLNKKIVRYIRLISYCHPKLEKKKIMQLIHMHTFRNNMGMLSAHREPYVD